MDHSALYYQGGSQLPGSNLKSPIDVNTAPRAVTPLCRQFTQGFCPRGRTCKFNHPDQHEDVHFPPYFRADPFAEPAKQDTPVSLNRPRPSQLACNPTSPLNVGRKNSELLADGSTSRTAKLQFLAYLKPLFWKTSPCRHFVRYRGWCPLGDACGLCVVSFFPFFSSKFTHCYSIRPQHTRSDASESLTALLAARLVHRGLPRVPMSVFSPARSSPMYVLLKFKLRVSNRPSIPTVRPEIHALPRRA